jgi:hypothetical protein
MDVTVLPTRYVAIEFRLPLAAPNACMPADPPWFPTYKYLPFGSAAKKLGSVSEANGESVIATGNPVADVMENVAMLLDPWFATYK